MSLISCLSGSSTEYILSLSDSAKAGANIDLCMNQNLAAFIDSLVPLRNTSTLLSLVDRKSQKAEDVDAVAVAAHRDTMREAFGGHRLLEVQSNETGSTRDSEEDASCVQTREETIAKAYNSSNHDHPLQTRTHNQDYLFAFPVTWLRIQAHSFPHTQPIYLFAYEAQDPKAGQTGVVAMPLTPHRGLGGEDKPTRDFVGDDEVADVMMAHEDALGNGMAASTGTPQEKRVHRPWQTPRNNREFANPSRDLYKVEMASMLGSRKNRHDAQYLGMANGRVCPDPQLTRTDLPSLARPALPRPNFLRSLIGSDPTRPDQVALLWFCTDIGLLCLTPSFFPSQHLIFLHNLHSLRFSNRSYTTKPTVILLLSLSQPKAIIALQRRFQTASPSCEVMVQTPILSSRRLFFSRYSSLSILSIFVYLYVLSISVCTPFSSPAENLVTLFYPTLMASSSTNPNPIIALDDEDSLLSNSTPFEEFFPRLHPTSDAQDLQQAVDQFLHVDSPQSSPNPRISTQSPQLVSSSSTRPATYTATTHAMPSFPVRPSAPIITDSISVSTNIDKGKGKAPMFVPTTHPSRGASGIVINASCPPPTAAIPSVVRPNFMHAAIDHHNGLTGAGFVFKRGYQTVLASQYRRLPGVVSPIFSEGQALLQSLKWCIDSQFSPQVVFSDCLNLVSKVNGDWQDNSALSGNAISSQNLSQFTACFHQNPL
ncbi:hypothetical protein G4B88_011052 [Cannabis sativa]|uniref:RNase H type-1 domain-containing protein n=1 Tax=Cannabis sativa TaxID=3483 RepID=A0A7J6DKF4_CANSA|nr:hypothetical protein G4B88_011052 [Cannabis sativa]